MMATGRACEEGLQGCAECCHASRAACNAHATQGRPHRARGTFPGAGRQFANRRGVALLLVLWLVALLAMVTIAGSGAARGTSDLVVARRASATARSMAESGIASALVAIDDSLRALLADSTHRDAFLNALDAGVNGGVTALGRTAHDTVGDGAFSVAVVDVSARLDVNDAGEHALASFLLPYAGAESAQALAQRIVARVRGDGLPRDSAAMDADARDSVVRTLLGRSAGPSRLRHPFESVEELLTVPDFDERILTGAAPLLTVDGDGHINRRSAPRAVLLAATGTTSDSPSRLLLVARGWQLGHPLTHEIQAVYDVSENGLRLVRWRERTL